MFPLGGFKKTEIKSTRDGRPAKGSAWELLVSGGAVNRPELQTTDRTGEASWRPSIGAGFTYTLIDPSWTLKFGGGMGVGDRPNLFNIFDPYRSNAAFLAQPLTTKDGRLPWWGGLYLQWGY